MEAVSNFRILVVTFLLLFFIHLWANASNAARCSVCGMIVKEQSHTSFLMDKDGTQKPLCSFACASKVKDRDAQSQLKATDYVTGEAIQSEEGFYLLKSKSLAKEVEFGMPPVVGAFKTREKAEEALKRLGDGEIVKGFGAARQQFK